MTSDLGVGDAETPYVDVAPADTDTAVTLTVNPPSGTPYAVTMTGGTLTPIPGSDPAASSQRWTADTPVTYSVPGRWVLHFDVDGTGEAVEDLEVYVASSPVAGGPTWLPGRSKVANYVPHRTLVRSLASTVGSQDGYAFTFDSTTTPPAISVDALIVDAAAWIGGRVPNLTSTHHELARAACALLVGAWIERSWPNDDQSLQRANDMEKRVDVLLADLVAASNASAGTDDFGLEIVSPAFSFPAADPRWDDARYW